MWDDALDAGFAEIRKLLTEPLPASKIDSPKR